MGAKYGRALAAAAIFGPLYAWHSLRARISK